MSRVVYESARPHTPGAAFLSIIETIIARIPLPFKLDKPRLAAGEKENTWRPTADRGNFFNLPSLCASSVRVDSPPVNYSPHPCADFPAMLELISKETGDGLSEELRGSRRSSRNYLLPSRKRKVIH